VWPTVPGTLVGQYDARVEGRGRAVALRRLAHEVVACRACPRLVEWREQVARDKRASFQGERYWGKPIPGFGDPAARVLIVGLAPAAHGANRTGRMFTGDRSGDWLYAALHRAGYANQATSVVADDGLLLTDAFVTAAVRCAPPANRPTPQERDRCSPFLVRELTLMPQVRVIVTLGGFAYEATWRVLSEAGVALPRPRPRFGHGIEVATPRATILGCYHPSQQNTFTGKLTVPMLDAVFAKATALAQRSDRISPIA
jgi:uracil-DNA glycosylase family 4